jgi:hypothetical protein
MDFIIFDHQVSISPMISCHNQKDTLSRTNSAPSNNVGGLFYHHYINKRFVIFQSFQSGIAQKYR